MPYLNDLVLDSGLAYATTNGTRLDVCSSEPANYAGIAAVSLGNDTVTTGSAANGSPNGRAVTVAAITAGSITATGTASHWALSDGAGVLIAANALSASQSVTIGNPFTLDATIITIADATSV